MKGVRWYRRCGPELSHRRATQFALAYFAFFPVDLWFFSQATQLPGDSQNLGQEIGLFLLPELINLASSAETTTGNNEEVFFDSIEGRRIQSLFCTSVRGTINRSRFCRSPCLQTFFFTRSGNLGYPASLRALLRSPYCTLRWMQWSRRAEVDPK